MPVPDYETLMLPVLREAAKGETSISALVASIAAELRLSDADLAEQVSRGRPLINSRVQWAKTYLLQAGLLESPGRGVVRVTERGRSVLRKPPEEIDAAFLRQYPEFVDFERRSRSSGTRRNTPWERIEAAHEEITASLRADLLSRIRAKPPRFLEELVLRLMRKIGYGDSRADAGKVVGGAGDGGVDVVINEDRLGLGIVCLQVKRYGPDRLVSPSEVRNFMGALDLRGATKGVFVTTSTFTDAAQEAADRTSPKKIRLISGEELATLLIENEICVQTEHTVRIQRIDQDAFDEEGSVEVDPTPSTS